MLGRSPGRLREAEHFAREALDLSSDGQVEGAPEGVQLHSLSKGKKKKKRAPVTADHRARCASLTSSTTATWPTRSLRVGPLHDCGWRLWMFTCCSMRRDVIVTSMVRLKYGKDSLISHKLIAEASISLSESY